MPAIISVGSGKGGVGKSVLSTNIAYLLGRTGLSVTLVDLDSGGADIHILMGLFRPHHTLTDFIEKRVESLEEVAQKLEGFNKIRVVTGTGDSLHTANMPSATKYKLLRHIHKINSDVVIIDVGAGTHFNTLDFFIASDIQICVTTGDPTAILDLYRFIKLSVIRKALSSFLAYDEVSKIIRKRDIKDIDELLMIASEYGEDHRQLIDDAIAELNPCIVFNQVDTTPNAKFSRLKTLLLDYLKITNLDLLGKIPDDHELRKSVKVYQPVTSLKPGAPSSLALEVICSRLLKHIDRLKT
jgi:flagellar biosynthesis protein FlhG